jgi:hypothetical protein
MEDDAAEKYYSFLVPGTNLEAGKEWINAEFVQFFTDNYESYLIAKNELQMQETKLIESFQFVQPLIKAFALAMLDWINEDRARHSLGAYTAADLWAKIKEHL